MINDDNLFEPWEIKTHRRRPKRRPTLASVSRQALKAGATKVTLAPDGTVSLEFGRIKPRAFTTNEPLGRGAQSWAALSTCSSGSTGAQVAQWRATTSDAKAPSVCRCRACPDPPSSSAAYQAALAGQIVSFPVGVGRTRAGNIGALVMAYFSSPQFLGLSAGTQQTYRLILEKFRVDHGDKPVALLTRQHLNAMLAQRTGTPAAANHWLRLVKALMVYAVREGFRADNPAVDVERIRGRRSDGLHSWTEAQIGRFRGRHLGGHQGATSTRAWAVYGATSLRRGPHGSSTCC